MRWPDGRLPERSAGSVSADLGAFTVLLQMMVD
jgi:hypothetical protein